MNKREREAEVLRRAREMARSGNFSGWLPIEHAIRREGLNARGPLDNQMLRSELDDLCKRAQEGSRDATRP